LPDAIVARIVVALGGLFVGWLVYRSMVRNACDEPLRRPDPMGEVGTDRPVL
jgi:hypothetical protein